MTARTQFIGQIQRPGQRPENVELVVQERRSPVIPTFEAADATPTVRGDSFWQTDTGTLTITDLDDGQSRQIVTILSRGAVTFDVTGTNLNGGTTDIVTASGDLTQWLCEDGTTWTLIAFMNNAANNASGA